MLRSTNDKVGISVELFSGLVRENDREVMLSPRERQFLFCLCAAEVGLKVFVEGGPAVRVLALRLRRRFKEPLIAAAGSGRYRLLPHVDVDLRALRAATLGSTIEGNGLHQARRMAAHAMEMLTRNPNRRDPWFTEIGEQLRVIALAILTSDGRGASLVGLWP